MLVNLIKAVALLACIWVFMWLGCAVSDTCANANGLL